MGVYGFLRRIAAADVERIREDPELLEAFLFGEKPIVVEDRLPGFIGFLLRFTPIKVQRVEEAPPNPNPLWPPAGEDESFDFEKSWHPLHYLLTGTAWEGTEPANFIVEGGEPLGDDDDVNVRLLRPPLVRAVADLLGTLTPDEIARRYDPVTMEKLRVWTPGVADGRALEADRRYLLDMFGYLRDFMTTAADRGDAVVVCIS
jgi:hypothetical protein